MVLVVLSDAELQGLAGGHIIETEPPMSKVLVQIKFGTREADHSRFSSEVKEKNDDCSGITVTLWPT